MQQNKLQYLGEACQTLLPFDAQISIVSWKNIQFSHSIEILLLIAEYFQLATQTILLYDNLYDSNKPQNPFHAALIYLAKILNPGYLFNFGEGDNFTWVVLSIVLAYSVLRYMLFGAIIVLFLRRKELNKRLALIWKWIFKLQARVLYGAVTSFWVQSILQVNVADQVTIFGAEKTSVVIIFAILTISEFAFCFWLKSRYYLLLPTKSLLSSKDTRIETMNLAQKFILQILQIALQNAFTSSGNSKNIIFAIVNLIFTLCRVTYHFTYLPLYHVKGLLYQGILIMILASFNVSRFFQIAIYWNGSDQDFDYIMTMWAILAILTIRLAYGYLNRAVFSLATENLQVRVPFLIQKLNMIWQYKEQKRMPVDFAYKFESLYLANAAIASNLESSLGSIEKSGHINSYSTNSEEYFDYVCIYHLEAALANHPRDRNLIKLYLAQLYGKRLNQYGQALEYLIELRKSPKKIIAQNASSLLLCIQNKIRLESTANNRKIDTNRYFISQTKFGSLQKKMIKQGELQMSLYQELMEKVPDLTKIYIYSNHIQSYRKKIQREGTLGMANIPNYHTVPVLLYAQYQLLLNHSLANYFKHFKAYAQRYQHYQRHYQSDDFTPETYYQERTTMVLVSNQKEDHGKIRFCAKSVGNIFGGEDSHYLGAHISLLSPLNTKDFDLLFSKTNTDGQEHNALNRVFRGYCNHKNGYIIEANFYIDIFPFLTQGFYYCVYIRQVQMSEDCVLIDENGIIQGATKDLMQNLGLKKGTDIKLYSEELAQINDAFNLVIDSNKGIPEELDVEVKDYQSKRKYLKHNRLNLYEKNLKAKIGVDPKKAKELYSIFSTKGRDIQITKTSVGSNDSVSQKGIKRAYTYNCKVTNLSEGASTMRLISLKEQQGSYDSLSKIKTSPAEPRSIECQQENSNSDWVGSEDEKQAGWIDMKSFGEKPKEKDSLQSKGEDVGTTLFSRNLTTEGNLLSPLSIGKSNRKSTIEMLAQGFENKLRKVKTTEKKSEQVEIKKQEEKLKVKGLMVLNASRSSKTSHAKFTKISQSLDSALTSRYYSKHFRFFYLFFYLLLLGLLATQIHLNSLLNQTADNLQVKKEILKNSQLRDFSLGLNYRLFRGMVDIQNGALNTTQSEFSIPFAAFVFLATATTLDLADTNQELQLNAGQVDESLREVLYNKDVMIFYNDTNGTEYYVNYTTFQAIEMMVSASLDVLVQSQTNILNAKESLNFIFRNAVNDLLVKTEAATTIFLEAVEVQVKQEKKIILISEIIMTVLLSVTLILFIFIISNSYSQDKLNMIALTRFDMDEIKEMQNRIAKFRRVLETVTPDEGTDILQSSESQNIFVFNKKIRNSKSFKTANHSGILRRYMLYILKTIALCSGLITIPIWTSALASKSINFLYAEQSKLYFVNSMSKIINMAYLAYYDLYSTNDTSYVRNEPLAVEYTASINDLSTLRNQFLQLFLNDVSYSDPVYSRILLGPDCSFIITTSLVDFCSYLQNMDKTLTLVSLLTDYEYFVKEKQDEFFSSNRTVEALRAIQAQDFDVFMATQRVLLNEAQMVSDRTDVIFENRFTETKTQGKVTVGISATMIVVISCIIWVIVIRELREGPNRFKNVLQNFPPSLILSNFIIKSFLIKTSESVFDLNKLNL